MGMFAEMYLRKAEAATMESMETHDRFISQAYSKIAHHWYELAERVARQESPSAESERPSSSEATLAADAVEIALANSVTGN